MSFSGLRKLRRLALWLRIALVLYIGVTVLVISGAGMLAYYEAVAGYAVPEWTITVLLNLPGNAVLGLATVLFLAWLHRARVNLGQMGVRNLRYSPALTIGWFFVPLANLVMPFRILREIYHRSHGEDEYQVEETVELVNSWWGCTISGALLAAGIAVLLLIDMTPGVVLLTPPGINTALAMAALALLCGSAYFPFRLVATITSAQQSVMGLTEAFA